MDGKESRQGATQVSADSKVKTDAEPPSLSTVLINLDDGYNKSQFHMIKVVFSLLGINFICLEECTSFPKVFRLLKQKIPDQAVSVTVTVLSRIGISKFHLDPLEPFVQTKFTVEDNREMDLVLTLGEVLMNMNSKKYSHFVELVCERFLRTFHTEKLSCQGKLLEELFFRDLISEKYLDRYFALIDGAGCPKQLETLRMFCARHGIKEPSYRQQSQVRYNTYNGRGKITKDTSSIGPESLPLPSLLSLDGGATEGVSHSSDKGHVTPNVDTTLPFNHTSEHNRDVMSDDVTEGTEPSGIWDYEPQQTDSTREESSSLVVTKTQPTQAPLPPPAVGRDNPGKSVSQTDPRPPPSGKPITMPININGDLSERDSSSGIPVHSYERPTSIQAVTDRKQKKNRQYLTKRERRCCIILCSIVLILFIFPTVVFLSLWCSYSAHNHILLKHPESTRGQVGSNTTNLLGCYNPSITRQVHVLEIDNNANYDAQLYKVKRSDLRIKGVPLSDRFHTFEEDYGALNVPVNYLYGDYPVYVADRGTLTYQIITLDHLSSSTCAFQFFLFKEYKHYYRFTNSKDPTPLDYFLTSGCFPAGSISKNISFNFTLPAPGYYYVAAHINNHVKVNVTIGGSLTSYDTSDILREDCSLNSAYRQCTFDIGVANVPLMSQEHVCILAKSDVDKNNGVNITRENVKWNVTSVLYFTGYIPFFLLGLISFVCCGLRLRSGRKPEYLPLLSP